MFLEIPPGHAVLQRHHHGVGTEQRIRADRRLLERVRLDREHDQVLLTGERRALDRFDARGFLASILPMQPDAPGLDRVELRAAADDGHLLAGDRQPACDESANRPGAENANSHPACLAFAGLRSRLGRRGPGMATCQPFFCAIRRGSAFIHVQTLSTGRFSA